uniref:Tetraspanin 17 n=1 Tax=Propithecus coquereli TaxID=379532 RepID=A0A2K6FJ31_PROCO
MPGKHQHFQEPEVGCCGKYFLFGFNIVFWFSVFLGLIFFLELATGILAFVFKDWIRDQLNLFINNNVKAYRDDIDLQNLIDFAQEYVSPASSTGHTWEELEQQGFIHTKGCVGQFEKWLQDNLIVVAGVFVGIALLQVLPWLRCPRPCPGLP